VRRGFCPFFIGDIMVKAIVKTTVKFTGLGIVNTGTVYEAESFKELPEAIQQEIAAGTEVIQVIENSKKEKPKPEKSQKKVVEEEEVEEEEVEEEEVVEKEKPKPVRRRKRTQ
jgi:hypothetical protein